MLNLDEPMYALGETAKAADMKVSLLKNWTDREIFEPDRPASGHGTRALFSLRTVLHIALTAQLVEMGVTPIRASAIASIWTHTRHGPGPDEGVPGRDFGGLFGGGFWTVFAFSKAGGDATIRAVDPRKTLAADAFTWLGQGPLRGTPRVSMVLLDTVHSHVVHELNVRG